MNYTNLHYPIDGVTLPINAYDPKLVREKKDFARKGRLIWYTHYRGTPVDPVKFQCVLVSVAELVFRATSSSPRDCIISMLTQVLSPDLIPIFLCRRNLLMPPTVKIQKSRTKIVRTGPPRSDRRWFFPPGTVFIPFDIITSTRHDGDEQRSPDR